MSFNEQFTIVNNTSYTLVLDQVGSQNLGNGTWPTSIAPHTTTPVFTQSAPLVDLNPTAVYQLQGANPANTAYLHFYCTGVDPVLHVNMTMKFSGNTVQGSSIQENNTDNGNSWEVNDTSLDIETTGNGSSRGEAVFTIGS